MKKILAVLLLVCVVVFTSGCELWMSGEYYSERPHLDDSAINTSNEIEVSSYAQLCNQLLKMVSIGRENFIIYYPAIESSKMEGYMSSAAHYVMEQTPLGAYAVEDIQYDNGTSSGKRAVAVTVIYEHGRSEILQIKEAADMEQFRRIVTDSLVACDAAVTVNIKNYEPIDIQQLVQDYMDQNPELCMELPQVVTTVYPEDSQECIIEVIFSYQTSRDELRKMQQTVSPVFDAAELYVSGDAEPREKYFQLYSFLMERHDYKIETSLTPTYHLIRHGVGDSKAFAAVYASMCRRADLDCQVVTGTKDGEVRYWNVIFDGTNYLYIDLLACNEKGRFSTKTASEMDGYVWDYDLYQVAAQE